MSENYKFNNISFLSIINEKIYNCIFYLMNRFSVSNNILPLNQTSFNCKSHVPSFSSIVRTRKIESVLYNFGDYLTYYEEN